MYREEVLKEIIDNQFLFADRRGPVPSPCLTGLQGKKPACRQAWGKGRATATRGRAAACSPAPCKEAQACPFGGRPAPPCGRTCAGKRAEVCPHEHRPEGSDRGKVTSGDNRSGGKHARRPTSTRTRCHVASAEPLRPHPAPRATARRRPRPISHRL